MKKSGTYKDYEQYLKGIVKKYVPKLFLDIHDFEITRGVENESSHFDFSLNYPYFNQKIGYSEKSFKDWKDGKDQIPFMVHELCHAITDPLYTKAGNRFSTKTEIKDEMERLTDYICQIVLKNEH